MLLLNGRLHLSVEASLSVLAGFLLQPGRRRAEARQAGPCQAFGHFALYLAKSTSALHLHPGYQYGHEVQVLRLAEQGPEGLSELTKGNACTDNRQGHG